MTSALGSGPLLSFPVLPSTQDKAAELLAKGESVGIVLAHQQTKGRGRLQRTWLSEPGASLTASFVMTAYADWPKPFLVGMAVAVAAAGVLHCHLQWPNDLVIGPHKLGGILTELVPDKKGRKIPVVGIGVNLNQKAFPPEIADRAVSLFLDRGGEYIPETVARQIDERLTSLPDPHEWQDLQPHWAAFDLTRGKSYELPDGRRALAIEIGHDGRLVAAIEGEPIEVLAADAIFGAAEA